MTIAPKFELRAANLNSKRAVEIIVTHARALLKSYFGPRGEFLGGVR